jgi:hypothetical protein
MAAKKLSVPCATCPWRLANQGKPHRFGWFTKANLTRLWNQIRKGGGAQSCHKTDPQHPEHVACGAKPGSKALECPGSVIVVLRELRRIGGKDGEVTAGKVDAYMKARKKGLTRQAVLYWMLSRMTLGNTIMGDGPLPTVDDKDAAVGLPKFLEG